MNLRTPIAMILAAGIGLVGCGESEHDGHDHSAHEDAGSHDGHDHGDEDGGHGDHGEEVALADTEIGGMTVELVQGFGPLGAGKEGQLVVKLPYSDQGETVVRAWIGGPDRTLSFVGRGKYASAHDDYDVHAMAPDPLPEDAMWWIEIEKPDGTKAVGSAAPHVE